MSPATTAGAAAISGSNEKAASTEEEEPIATMVSAESTVPEETAKGAAAAAEAKEGESTAVAAASLAYLLAPMTDLPVTGTSFELLATARPMLEPVVSSLPASPTFFWKPGLEPERTVSAKCWATPQPS